MRDPGDARVAEGHEERDLCQMKTTLGLALAQVSITAWACSCGDVSNTAIRTPGASAGAAALTAERHADAVAGKGLDGENDDVPDLPGKPVSVDVSDDASRVGVHLGDAGVRVSARIDGVAVILWDGDGDGYYYLQNNIPTGSLKKNIKMDPPDVQRTPDREIGGRGTGIGWSLQCRLVTCPSSCVSILFGEPCKVCIDCRGSYVRLAGNIEIGG
jgi:hypothetical protein